MYYTHTDNKIQIERRNKLEESIKVFSLIFTDTIDENKFCRIGFNLEEEVIDTYNCVSLYDIVNTLSKTYREFKKEYDELDKFDLGEYVDIDDYLHFTENGDEYRVLKLYIENPTITNHEYTYLYIREINGEMRPFVADELSSYGDGYYEEDVKLDDDKTYSTEKFKVVGEPSAELDSYTVSLSGDLKDSAYVVNEKGKKVESTATFDPSDAFYVRVPADKLSDFGICRLDQCLDPESVGLQPLFQHPDLS